MRSKSKRLTVSLDLNTYKTLETLSKELGIQSMGEVVRRAINFYNQYYKVEPEKLRIYIDLLTPGDHLIIDEEYMQILWREINTFSDEYYGELKRISKEHGKYFYSRYKKDLHGLLKFFESLNWLKVVPIEKGYVLILNIPRMRETIKIILEIVMSELELKDYIIRESGNKLFIEMKSF